MQPIFLFCFFNQIVKLYSDPSAVTSCFKELLDHPETLEKLIVRKCIFIYFVRPRCQRVCNNCLSIRFNVPGNPSRLFTSHWECHLSFRVVHLSLRVVHPSQQRKTTMCKKHIFLTFLLKGCHSFHIFGKANNY